MGYGRVHVLYDFNKLPSNSFKNERFTLQSPPQGRALRLQIRLSVVTSGKVFGFGEFCPKSSWIQEQSPPNFHV